MADPTLKFGTLLRHPQLDITVMFVSRTEDPYWFNAMVVGNGERLMRSLDHVKPGTVSRYGSLSNWKRVP